MTFIPGSKPEQIPVWGFLRSLFDIGKLRMSLLPTYTIEQLRASRLMLGKAVLVTDAGKIGIFYRDDADTTSADDGQNCLVTADDVPVRFKRRQLLRNYTPTLGNDPTMELGSMTYDDNYLYIKTGATTIKKVALTAL